MLDERIARVKTYHNNIARYRRLLKTNLTDQERKSIERRLSEEQSECELLSAGNLASSFDPSRPKGITRAGIDRQGAMNVGSRSPICSSVEVTNRAQLRNDRFIVVSLLFLAAAVTTSWMIGLAWGAITLAEWLFS